MKQYPHIVSKLFYEPLVITRARHAALCKVVESHMARVDSGDADEPQEKAGYTGVGKTAIIPVHGVIVPYASDIPMSSCGCGLDDVRDMIDVAMSDDNVTRLLFDFRTPGGDVTGLPETGAKIASIQRKDTIAYTGSECCSGGMWLASQCQQFYCSGSSYVGSIGVWTAYLDMSKAMKKEGVNMQAISAGKFKLMGAYWKPLTDEEKAILQTRVDKIHAQFKDAILSRRQISDEFMQGQIFDGREACEIGLCDGEVDDIEELIEDGED